MEKIGKRIRIIVYLFSLFFIENVILQPAVSLKPLNNLKNVIIYNFRDGSPPMVVGLGDNWKTSRDKAGKTIFFRENWKDPVSNKLYHWIDKDHNPWHAYESKSNRPPVSIQIFTLSKTKPVWLGKDKFKSRNSKLFKEMDSLVDDEIPEEYQWISQENEPITPPPPPPPEASWPIPQIPLSNLIVNGISCCIENEISLFTTDVDMSPCANAPKYEFFVDRFTWMFLDPWDDEPGAGDISSFAGEKHIGLQAKYSFTVPSSSEETLEMDEYRSEILIQLDFSYMLKEDNNEEESTLVANSYSPTRRICRVYVKDKIPP